MNGERLQLRADSSPDQLGCVARDFLQPHELGFAIHETDDGLPVTSPDDRIGFPVATTPLGLHDLGARLDTSTALQLAAPIITTIALTP